MEGERTKEKGTKIDGSDKETEDRKYMQPRTVPGCMGTGYIEVWEDIVDIKDMLISLIICSAAALGGYFMAPNEPPRPLFFGLSGAIAGFIICTILIKPKRTVEGVDMEG